MFVKLYRLRNIIVSYAQAAHFLFIGADVNLPPDLSCYIGHSDLGSCSILFPDNRFGKFAELNELFITCQAVGKGYIQHKHRDIGGAGFYYSWSLEIIWKVVHGAVDLFVYLHEGKVDVVPEFEREADQCASVPRFGFDLIESLNLQQVAAKKSIQQYSQALWHLHQDGRWQQ